MYYDDSSSWEDYNDWDEYDYSRPKAKHTVKEHFDGDFYCVPILDYDIKNSSIHLLMAGTVYKSYSD